MSLKLELVELMARDGSNVSELCRRLGVSRKTAYKWLRRYRERGAAGLAEQSRRPRRSPKRTPRAVESSVLALREQHPAWGPRKLRRRLLDLGHDDDDNDNGRLPSPSTIGVILRRNGRVRPEASAAVGPWQRFERPAPNDLWQGDFKGHFALGDDDDVVGVGDKGTPSPPPPRPPRRCHPLTVLDDHSRYNLVLAACADQTAATVRAHLTEAFGRYGLPRAMLFDNGGPWGCSHAPLAYTALELWLMRLGVLVLHGRPHHPQTQGKEERFHRTLAAEVLQGRRFGDLAEVQGAFDPWREVYNFQRPHEALGLGTPATRYAPSVRRFPAALPDLLYAPGDAVRCVNACGVLSFGGRRYFLGEGFAGERVGLRPTTAATESVWGVYYGRFQVGRLDPNAPDARVQCVRPRHTSAAAAAAASGSPPPVV